MNNKVVGRDAMRGPVQLAVGARAAGHSISTAFRWVLVLAFLACAWPSAADAADVNADCRGSQAVPSSNQYDCIFVPVTTEWRYSVGGYPYPASETHMDESAAKADFLAKFIALGGTYCSAPHWAGEDAYTSTWDGITYLGWRPDQMRIKRKVVWFEHTRKLTDPPAGPGGCAEVARTGVLLYAVRTFACPDSTWQLESDLSANVSYCKKRARTTCEACSPHPIAVPSGDKLLFEMDYASPVSSGLVWRRVYRSSGKIYPRGAVGTDPYEDGDGLGRYWSHSFERALVPSPDATTPLALRRGDNIIEFFNVGSGGYPRVLAPWSAATQSKLVATSASEYLYYSADNLIEVFEQGKLALVQYASGPRYTLGYNADGRLAQVQDHFGRQLTFGYDAVSGRLNSVANPAGQVIGYEYSAPLASGGNEGSYLTKVNYPDQTSKQYVMTPAQILNGPSLPHLIYGVVNESGKRHSTFTYTPQGSAASSELAGGVNRWTTDTVSLTDPQGTTRTRTYIIVDGMKLLSAESQPAGSGSGSASKSYIYDANSNVTMMYDYAGSRTCYAYDLTRNLETVRIEGPSGYGDSCTTYLPAGASLVAGARKISTEWHPDWRLAVREATPRRLITSVYNGQPDPFAGGAAANCAPADALLPDGKPIAVLCKRVEQATTDTNGASGFSASLQAGVSAREWKWTYNRWGQVLTEDGPRTDVVDVTTYVYYANTTADHTMGDLQSVTNAAGQVTQFTKYNAHGQLLESVNPKGVLTVHTYDQRLRLTSTTLGGRTTSYSYEPTGDLKRISQSDGSWIENTYDDARRVIAVTDSRGNQIAYTLDNAGNRLQESIKDPNGSLQRSITRSFDALGRVKQSNER